MPTVPALLALVLLIPCAATRASTLQLRQGRRDQPGGANLTADPRLKLPFFLKTLADECKCHYSAECTCPGSMDFMHCITSACNSGACACGDTHFLSACSAMAETCSDVGLVCTHDQATCVNHGHGEIAPAPRTEKAEPPPRPKAELKVETLPEQLDKEVGVECMTAGNWGMIPGVTWLVLVVVTACLNPLMKGPLKKSRHVITAILIVVWTAMLAATYFRAFSCHGWTFLESLYFAVTTLTTVGYGDYVPYRTPLDMVAGIFFIWFVVGVLAICLSIVTGDVVNDAGTPKDAKSEVTFYLSILVGFAAVGAFLFSFLEGWTVFDAMFFSVVTLSTVGYGSHEVSTPAGMVAAICYMLLGVPVFGAFMGSLGSQIDGLLSDRKNKMSKMSLFGAYVGVIVGWLVFGATAVHLLNTHGWTWPECFYFAAVTMTTVGYGDYVPTKTVGDKLLTLAYILTSVVVVAAVFGDLNSLVISGLTAGLKKGKALALQAVMLVVIVVGGACLFAHLEGWSLLQSVFFTTVTCTTVGYGHLVPTAGLPHMVGTAFILMTVPMTGALVGNISGQYQDKIQKFFGI